MFKEPILKSVQKEENGGNEILSRFSPEQQDEIEKKRKILSSLAFFVGKDFEIPVELNTPGEGWHWDFKNNIIKIDPIDLLKKPMDYLRFVISHEGGHRRITRTDFIPQETWRQPGFSFMMNSIEDSRDNNFVAESYSKFREQLSSGYEWLEKMEKKLDDKAKNELGYIPRFKQAGYEYIRQWYKEEMDENVEIREDLPDDVKEVVQKTLDSARDSWFTFPTKDMADGKKKDEDGLTGEDSIVNHAKYSYNINLKKV